MEHDRLIGRIKERAIRHLPRQRLGEVNVYLEHRLLHKREALTAMEQEIPVPRESMMVFVDEEPMANWSHDCRYLMFDTEQGELYDDIPAQFPPTLLEPPESFEAFHVPVVVTPLERKLFSLGSKLGLPWFRPDGRRFTVLFSGASNNRHTNDLEFLYRTLRDQYYFRDDDIYVLNYDGSLNYSGGPKPVTSWPGDGSSYRMPVKGKGTKADFDGVIDDIKERIEPRDLLLIHTNNHGGYNGTDAYLCTYSPPSYMAPSFASKLAELPPFRDLVVMMEQCHSGGFNDLIVQHSPAERTSFSAACAEFRNSIGGANFDPFAQDWIASLAGADPYGWSLAFAPNVTGEGRVSVIEAFAYADRIHHSYDSPVYTERGAGAADAFLEQRWKFVWWHEFLEPILVDMWADQVKADYWEWAAYKLEPRLREFQAELERTKLDDAEARQSLERIVREVM